MNLITLHVVILTIFFSSFIGFAQQDTSSIKLKYNCEDGTQMAIKDASEGKYKLITYGLVASTDWDFDKFYWEYVKDKYNVTLGTGGCVVNDYILCYSKKMRESIEEKFGKDFLERAKNEARLAYGKTTNNR